MSTEQPQPRPAWVEPARLERDNYTGMSSAGSDLSTGLDGRREGGREGLHCAVSVHLVCTPSAVISMSSNNPA